MTNVDWLDRPTADRLKTLAAALGLGLATALTGYLSYPAMFSYFAAHDDEGYMLVSIRAYNRGARLYDDIYSQYGPFFYQAMHGIWSALGLSVTHDTGRLLTIGFWLATSLLTGVITFWITRRLPLAVSVQLLTFHALLALRNEPMHPGGLLCLLLAILVAIPLILVGRPRATLSVLGAIGGAIVFVKINVGVFALVSVGFAFLTALPRLQALRAPRLAAGVIFVLMPFLLMASHLDRPWVLRYASLVAAAALGLAIACTRTEPGETRRPREFVWLVLGVAVATLCVCSIALLRGTSLRTLVDAVFVLPLRMPAIFVIPLPLPPGTFVLGLCGVASLFSAWLALRRQPEGGSHTNRRTWSLASAIARLATGGLIWVTVARVFPNLPLEMVPLPLAWVAAVPPRSLGSPDREGSDPFQFARHLLVSVAVLQALHAYPVAGSQVAWASFLLIPIGGLCISDGLHEMSLLARPAEVTPASRARTTLSAAPAVLLLGLVVAWLLLAHQQYDAAYRSGVPLPFAGAERMRLPAAQRNTYVWLTGQIRSRCDTFVTLPGLNSLYLFSGREPPTDLNTTSWAFLLSPAAQSRIVDRIKVVDHLCLVLNRRLVGAWAQGRILPAGPLLEYMKRELKPLQGRDGFELLVR